MCLSYQFILAYLWWMNMYISHSGNERIFRFDSPGVNTRLGRASGRYSIGDGSDAECSTERADQRNRRNASHRRRRYFYATANGGTESLPTEVHHRLRQTSFPRLPRMSTLSFIISFVSHLAFHCCICQIYVEVSMVRRISGVKVNIGKIVI